LDHAFHAEQFPFLGSKYKQQNQCVTHTEHIQSRL